MSEPSVPSNQPVRWEKLGDKLITPTRIFEVRSAHYRHPVRKTERDFFVVHAPDWANVIAVTTDRQIVLVRQFRFGVDEMGVEIPGGVIDAGEDPLAAGLRELREETGYTGEHARIIGKVHPNPAFLNNFCHLILVENAVRTDALEWDPDEEIEVLTAPIEQVYAWAHEGKITHSLVLDALFFFYPHWLKLQNGRDGSGV